VFAAVVCPVVPTIARAFYNCTDGNNFRSVCWYTCEDGYDMPPEVSKTIVCTKYGTWRGYGHQVCVGRQTLCCIFIHVSDIDVYVCISVAWSNATHQQFTLIEEKGNSKGYIACMGQRQHLVFLKLFDHW